MDWLLVALIVFHDGSQLGASKRLASEEECRRTYAEMTYVAAVDGTVTTIRHRCVELHGRDQKLVELSTALELIHDTR